MNKTILIIFISFIHLTNSNAQYLNKYISNGETKEMIILPYHYKFYESENIIGNVKTVDPSLLKIANYKTQLDKLCLRAEKIGGNILVINKVINHKLTERYNLKAIVYNVNDIEKLKDSVFNKGNARNYSELILYRPNYTYSLNDLVDLTIIVNGKEYLLTRNSKHILKFENESKIELIIKGQKEEFKIETENGKKYYVRCLVYFPTTTNAYNTNAIIIPLNGYIPKIDLISEYGQGEIESSLVGKP